MLEFVSGAEFQFMIIFTIHACIYGYIYIYPCISSWNPIKVQISADALRMRCRRMCEKKPSGRMHVDEETFKAYKEGGQSREILEMALLECLAKYGMSRDAYKRVKVSKAEISWLSFIGPHCRSKCPQILYVQF